MTAPPTPDPTPSRRGRIVATVLVVLGVLTILVTIVVAFIVTAVSGSVSCEDCNNADGYLVLAAMGVGGVAILVTGVVLRRR